MNSNNQPVILVLDDIPTNIVLVKALLKNKNYEVISAKTGTEALALAEERQPDVILLDIMMPVMDGYEVLARLRSNEKTKDLKVIMLSALASEEDITKSVELGADGYLTKPLVARKLYEELEKFTR
ncbi:MAG: response regulator [Bacteroidales bacterium]|nr:response regulator [Bacteroidales bacterium]